MLLLLPLKPAQRNQELNVLDDDTDISRWRGNRDSRLITGDRDAKRNKMNPLVEDVMVQCFNTFLPGLTVVTLDFKGKLVVGVVTMYPESPVNTNLSLNSYLDFEFAWWQKLLKFPQMANKFRVRLFSEDISILNNLYLTFNKKIALKNDTPAELAMNYLKNWDC